MKKIDSVMKDYVSKLPFDALKYLYDRFDERMGSDLAEAVELIAKNPDIDRFLMSAKDYSEFWGVVDHASSYVEKEFIRRTPDLVVHS